MAVVGEAHILVRALTTNVASDIVNGLKGVSGSTSAASRKAGESIGQAFSRGFNNRSNGIFEKVANGLRAMAPEADAARVQFRSLVRTSYTLGTALVAVVGGISALVGGLITLIGAAAAASASLLGVVGGLIQLRLATGLARFALNGVSQAVSAATSQTGGYAESVRQAKEQLQQLKFEAEEATYSQERAALSLERAKERFLKSQDLPANSRERREAELAFKEADLAYRRAKDRNNDLKAELSRGTSGAGGANADPFANLTPAQKEFAKFLVSLKPLVNDLREAIAREFLPELQNGISRVVKAFDGKLEPALGRFGDNLGLAVKNFTDSFISNSDADKIIEFFDLAGPNIAEFGKTAGKFFSTFLQLLIDAEPLTDGFFGFLSDSVDSFSKFLDRARNDGSLKDFFETSMQLMSDFGTIFGNIFKGFGEIIKASIGPGSGGQILLDYFKTATADFAALDGSAEGQGSLRQFFIDVAENAKPLLDLIGGIVKAFLDLGANKNIGEAFRILAEPENIQTFSDTLQKMGDAAPSLANLAVSIGDIIAALTDSEAAKAFFDTLNVAFSGIRDILQNEAVAGFVNFVSRIFAVISALTLLGGIAKFAFNVLIGNLIQVLTGVNLVKVGMTGFRTFLMTKIFGPIGTGIKALFTGLGPALRGLATAFILNIRLIFLRLMANLIPNLLNGFLAVVRGFGGIMTAILRSTFFLNLTKLFLFMKNFIPGLFSLIGGALATLGRTLFAALTGPWGIAISLLITGLTFFFTQTELGKKLWEGFVGFLSDGWKTFSGNLIKGWEGFMNFFANIGPNMEKVFKGIINGLIDLWEGFVNGLIFALNNGIIKGLNSIKIPIAKELVDAAKAVGITLPGQIGFNIAPIAPYKVPRLADGGTAFPTPGGTLVTVAEAGRPERIEPLDSNGLSVRDRAIINELAGGAAGMTINVYPSAGMNERELAAQVSREIAKEIRRGRI